MTNISGALLLTVIALIAVYLSRQRNQSKSVADIEADMAHSPVYEISQSDIETGTYRIDKPGKYVLKSDLVFDPNPANAGMPLPGDKRYSPRSFILGFFAVICVEAPNVWIDLNGHTISQSPRHALRQRFCSLIELANSPFISKQGPGDFGILDRPANGCIIENGTLGLSSHHGIHGNRVRNCVIRNLTIRDFEVCGIALNGGHSNYIDKCTVGPNQRYVPVNSAYSAAVFTLRAARHWKGLDRDVMDRLHDRVLKVEREVLESGVSSDEVFGNPGGIADGNNYGILVHTPGVAINDFIDEKHKGKYTSNIQITNTHVKDIATRAIEVLGICENKGAMTDFSGSVFRIGKVVDNEGKYAGDELSELQLDMAAKAQFQKHLNKRFLGKNNITQSLVTWARSGVPLEEYMREHGMKFKVFGDSMFHMQKGVFGIRVDGTKDMLIDNVNVSGIVNDADNSMVESLPEDLVQIMDHQRRPEYEGTTSIGINFSHCHDVNMINVHVTDVNSTRGLSAGIRTLNAVSHINVQKSDVSDVFGPAGSYSLWIEEYENEADTFSITGLSTELPVHRQMEEDR